MAKNLVALRKTEEQRRFFLCHDELRANSNHRIHKIAFVPPPFPFSTHHSRTSVHAPSPTGSVHSMTFARYTWFPTIALYGAAASVPSSTEIAMDCTITQTLRFVWPAHTTPLATQQKHSPKTRIKRRAFYEMYCNVKSSGH